MNNLDRLNKISQRLSSINTMVPESVKKADSLGKRLDLLEMRLEDDIEKQNRAISLIFSEFSNLEKKFKEDAAMRESLLKTQVAEMEDAERQIEQKMHRESGKLLENEKALIAMLDDKIKFLKTDLASEKYRRHEDMREVTDAAHNSFDKLEQGLNDEKNIQEEGDFVILQKVNERVEGMARDIKDHIENRESYEKELTDLVNNVVDKIRDEIKEERALREKTQDTILTLLEETCVKMESINRSGDSAREINGVHV